MIDVFYLSLKKDTPNNSYWDYTFLNDYLSGKMWRPYNFPKFNPKEVSKLPASDKAIVIIPARHHEGLEKQINQQLQDIDRVVVFLMGDEEADFNVFKIKHKRSQIWVQNPHPKKHDGYNLLGTGYAPISKLDYKPKSVDLFFSGQLTHKRRMDMWEQLLQFEILDGTADLNGTKGFTQGYEPKEYFERMQKAKFAPCPSGAVIPDSFRLHEALEMMCVPLADDRNSQGTIDDYWAFLYPDAPLITVKDWNSLRGYIQDTNKHYRQTQFDLTTWWIKYKRNFAYKVTEFINE